MAGQGNHDHQLGALGARMHLFEKRLDALEPLIRETHDALVTSRGTLRFAWKVVFGVATVGGVVAAIVSAISHWVIAHR